MDLVDLNSQKFCNNNSLIFVEILVDLVDLNSALGTIETRNCCRDPCGSRGSKYTRMLIVMERAYSRDPCGSRGSKSFGTD